MEGKGYAKLFAFGGRDEAFSVDLFRGGFDLNEFLSALCRETKIEETTSATTSSKPFSKAAATKNKVEKLLGDFRKCDPSSNVIQRQLKRFRFQGGISFKVPSPEGDTTTDTSTDATGRRTRSIQSALPLCDGVV